MPKLTKADLIELVRVRAGNLGIEAELGRKMNEKEKQIVRKARTAQRVAVAEKKSTPTLGSADRKAAATSERSKVDHGICEDPKRRKRLEKNPRKWLKWYLAGTFTRKFEKPHLQIIDGAVAASNNNSRFAVSAERGIGKSSVLWGLLMYFALKGEQRFPVCVPWADKALKRAFRFWKMALCFNDRLAADYPEYCAPFRHAKGIAQRVMQTTWRDSGNLTGAQLTVGEGLIVFPDMLGCIGGSTINGNVRGLNHPQEDGTVLRPSLVFLDDVQDRKTAKSAVQVEDTISIIDGDVAGCGDAGSDLPMLMSGNCIIPDDVMAHYLSSREWNGLRVPCVIAWPEGWDDEESECRQLWAKWYELLEGGRGAVTFYRKNKATMIKGMVLSSPSAFKRSNETPDPKYGAIRAWHKMGASAFAAERQQDPKRMISTVYKIDAKTILGKKSGLPRMSAPVGSVICCGIDINYVGFNWTVVAGDTMSRSRKVVAHGIWSNGPGDMIPKGVTVDEACNLLRKYIGAFTDKVLVPMRIRIVDPNAEDGAEVEHVGIEVAAFDASMGAWQEATFAAIKECNSKHKLKIWPLKAFGVKGYKPQRADLRAGKGWRITEWPRLGRALVINSDYWRMTAQRGFLANAAEAGSVSLYYPDADGANKLLANEIAGERLEEHVETVNNEYYTWRRSTGVLNDRADSFVYACALTGVEGVGEEKPSRKKSAARVVISRPSKRR